MFGFFKKLLAANDPPPFEPPTDKQLRYAKRLGIKVTPGMGKWDVSDAIKRAETDDPQLVHERERIQRKVRERKYGKNLVEEEEKWDRFAETTEYMLAIYEHRKETVVDVLRLHQAFLDDHGKLILLVEAPKLVKDRHIGEYLDWSKLFELPITKLRHCEGLYQGFADDEFETVIKNYKRAVEKGLKIARQL